MSGKFISACGSVGVFAAVCVCVFGQRTCKYLLCLSSAKKGEKKHPKKSRDKQKGFHRRQLEKNVAQYFLS